MSEAKKKYYINWSLAEELMSALSYTKADVSKMMGYNVSWLSNYSNANRGLSFAQLTQLATILNAKPEMLMKSESAHQVMQAKEVADAFEPSQFEIDVLEMLKAIKEKVDSDHEILMYLFNEKQQGVPEEKEETKEEPIDELETAMSVLTELLENRTAVRFEEYKEGAMEKGVTDLQVIDAVVAKLGHHKMTRGYGRNKTVWIYRQGDVNGRS